MGTIVTVFGKVAVDYECTACGHVDIAHVEAAGSGSGFSASQRVHDGARSDLYKNGARLAGCVPCPVCGAVNRAHRNHLRRLALFSGLGWTVGLILLTWLLMGAATDENTLLAMAAVGGGLVLLLSLPLYLTLRSRWWARAEQRVVFESRRESPPGS